MTENHENSTLAISSRFIGNKSRGEYVDLLHKNFSSCRQ